MKTRIEKINKEVEVNTSQKVAFKVFTEKMDLWWPKTHHIGKTPMVKQVLEPKEKGRWYSIHEDGTQCSVGYISNWNPTSKVVLIWQIDGDFKHNPNLVTEIEVNFIAEGPNKTRVKLEHRNLDRIGEGGKAVDSMDQGWGMILGLYKAEANKGE
jgi:hypothetical protein